MVWVSGWLWSHQMNCAMFLMFLFYGIIWGILTLSLFESLIKCCANTIWFYFFSLLCFSLLFLRRILRMAFISLGYICLFKLWTCSWFNFGKWYLLGKLCIYLDFTIWWKKKMFIGYPCNSVNILGVSFYVILFFFLIF